ncbi:MAG: 3'-5' exonuclease [Elusimicrobiota bacterium]
MKTDKPVIFIDLEATGISPYKDRIVEIAMLKYFPDGSEEFFHSLVNPRQQIPPAAMAIHHITDEMIAQSPSFYLIAERVMAFSENCDMAGFGILKFDIPLLSAEFSRAGFFFSTEGRRIVDALTIYHKMEPRNLAAAYQFYCGKKLTGAHRAEADTRAAKDIFLAQLAHYPDFPQDMDSISAWCRAKMGAGRS